MTDEYDTRVAEILDEASDESGTLLTPEEAADDAGHNLIEVAREADEFVASSEPRELLEAVGLGTLPDGSEAESVSEAIAKGDPERVEDLQRLLRLAKLGDRSDEEELEDATGGIRETIRQAQSETDETMTEDTDQDETPDHDETEQEATTDDESKEEADEGNGEDGEDADDLGDRLRAAMSSSFEEFGEEIGEIQEQLEEATADDEDEDDAEADDEEADDAEADDEEADDDEGDDEDDEDDDGLLGVGDGDDDGGGGLGSSDSSRHSTMAPPPSERADMRAVKRHSTMPKRNK